MKLTTLVKQNIIRRLLYGEDYRIEILTLIDTEFLQYVMDFFRRIVEIKLQAGMIPEDWYRQEFLNIELPTNELIISFRTK